MTPTALTPAARKQTKRSAAPPASAPRRVSGPARGSAGAVTRPRRVSGPARPDRTGTARPLRTAPLRRPATRWPAGARIALPHPAAVGVWTSAFVRSLPDARLLDRVVRGRAWIPILGVMLVGIVAMQVEILKLSANTGRSLQQVTALQSRNQQLLASDAVLGDDQRIERLAFHMNMVMPGPTQVRFLDPRANAIGHALSSIHAPNATTFLAALPAAPSTVAAASAGATSPSNPTSNPTPSPSSNPTSTTPSNPTSNPTTPSTTPSNPTSNPTTPTAPTTPGTNGTPAGVAPTSAAAVPAAG